MCNENDDHLVNAQKTKFLTGIGCFFAVIILGLIVVILPAWLFFSQPKETQLTVSHSPNNINTIEVVRIEDFPDPTIIIKYDNKSVMKTKLPDKISVKWKDDYEADVVLTKQGREPDIVKVTFE